jgi:hypothetical protein
MNPDERFWVLEAIKIKLVEDHNLSAYDDSKLMHHIIYKAKLPAHIIHLTIIKSTLDDNAASVILGNAVVPSVVQQASSVQVKNVCHPTSLPTNYCGTTIFRSRWDQQFCGTYSVWKIHVTNIVVVSKAQVSKLQFFIFWITFKVNLRTSVKKTRTVPVYTYSEKNMVQKYSRM